MLGILASKLADMPHIDYTMYYIKKQKKKRTFGYKPICSLLFLSRKFRIC